MEKLKLHYQLIQCKGTASPTIHEAFTRNGSLGMLNPLPLATMNGNIGDYFELTEIIEKDAEKHGILTYDEVEYAIDYYLETMDSSRYEDIDDFELAAEFAEDYYDENDNVIAIDEFIKRRK